MPSDQKIQSLEISFYKNPSIIAANNLIKHYIIYDQFNDAIEFIELLPPEYRANDAIQTNKTLIEFSMKNYWLRNKGAFLHNVNTTVKDLENLASIAFLSNQGADFFTIYKLQLFTNLYSPKIIQLSIKMSHTFDHAQHVFNSSIYKDDISILSAMLFACAKHNQAEKANEVFESIPTSYFNSPEYIVACEMMLLVFLKNNRKDDASCLFETIVKNSKLSNKTLLTMIKYSWNKTDLKYYFDTAPTIQEDSTTIATFTEEIVSTTDHLPDEINGTKPFSWVISNLLLKNQTKTALSLLYNFIKLQPKNSEHLSTYINLFLQYFSQFDNTYSLTNFLSKITTTIMIGKEPMPALISPEDLVLNHGHYILEILIKNQATQEIKDFYAQWKSIHRRPMLHAIFLDYFMQTEQTGLAEEILSELTNTDEKTAANIKQHLMTSYINEHNWPAIFETYQSLNQLPSFWKNTPLLIKLFEYNNNNGFHNFSYTLLERINIETIKQHPDLQEQIAKLCFLTENFQLFEALNLTDEPEKLTHLKILYYRTYILKGTTNPQHTLMMATVFDQPQALKIIKAQMPSLKMLSTIKDLINPYFKRFFNLFTTKIQQQQITSSELDIENILFKLECGNWQELLAYIDNIMYRTPTIAKLYLQSIYITKGFEATLELYNDPTVGSNLDSFTEIFLTILAKNNKYEEAITLYKQIKENLKPNSEINKTIAFCLIKTKRYNEAYELMLNMDDPKNLTILIEKDDLSIDFLNILLDSIPSTHLTYFFKIKILIKTNKNKLKAFAQEHFYNLNVESANLIIQSASTLNELRYWIENFPSKIKNQKTFLIIMQILLKNNFNKSQAINILNEIIDKIDLAHNISARFFNTKLQLKYKRDIEIPERINLNFWRSFLHQLTIDKLITIYKRAPSTSFFNQYFFKVFTKKATIQDINQLKNKENITDIIKALFINKSQINIDPLLEDLKLCENDRIELQLEAAIANNNQQKIITTLNHLSQTSVPQELRSIAKKALAKIWNTTTKAKVKKQLLATTPALFDLKEQKLECKKAAELNTDEAYLLFTECSNLTFVTPLDCSNIIKILQELLLQHQNNRTGFDFEKTKFTKQFSTVVLHAMPTNNSAKNKAQDVYNFAKWYINNLSSNDDSDKTYNITDFKLNVSEDIWSILMSCINENYLVRPSVEELLQEFTKTHNTMLTQCNL